jgi:dolichol kinase
MHFEIKRKLFHLLAITFPLLYYFTAKSFIITTLTILNVVILAVDINRHHIFKIKNLIDKFFSPIMRPSEQSGSGNLSGMSYMFLGFLLTAMMFNKTSVILSWLILVIADSAASIIGKKYGHRGSSGKSLEGSMAFFLAAIIVLLVGQLFLH